jgi:hypothetical protein
MRSPSFKRALRATIRACVVAISASNAAYADWNASLVSIPASCVVHDSGMEFLPLRFRAIAELDAFAEPLQPSITAFETIGPVDMVRETTTDHCVLAAVRHANYEKLSSRIEWARNQAGWFYRAASEWIDHYPVLPISWDRAVRSNSPFVARQLVSAFDNSSGPRDCPIDEVLDAQKALVGTESADSGELLWDCDQHHCGTKYQLQRDLADSESSNDAASGVGVLPSGHPANIFVFTLEASNQMEEPFQGEDRAEIAGSAETFDELADRSLSAAIASRIGRSHDDRSIDSYEEEFCGEVLSGTEVDAPIFENRFPIEEGCIPINEYLPGVLSDNPAGDELDGAPAIATTPEYLSRTLKDGVAPVSLVPEQTEAIVPDGDLVSTESELCLSLASDSGDGCGTIAANDFFANANEGNRVTADRIPIDPALNMESDEPNESWRSLFRPHGCIFAPEYLIDQPSVGIRSNTEIEPDLMSEELPQASPLNRDLAAVDAALRDPIGIGLDVPAVGARWTGSGMAEPEMQAAIISESVRWSDSAWVGYANDVAFHDRIHGSGEFTGIPMTKVFAQGLRWFGDWMVQWSDVLESQIRLAEGSEPAATHDR